MKFLFVPIIVLTSLLIGMAAIASESQVVDSDDEPGTCEMLKQGKSVETCNSFRFLKQDKFHIFFYDFKKFQAGFIATQSGEDEYKETYAVKQLYYDGKVYDLKNAGYCYRYTEFSTTTLSATCSFGDITVEYSMEL
ncbi:MAG: hypothetical protein RLZZ511_2008 [Cyanobacteriota bacterium]